MSGLWSLTLGQSAVGTCDVTLNSSITYHLHTYNLSNCHQQPKNLIINLVFSHHSDNAKLTLFSANMLILVHQIIITHIQQIIQRCYQILGKTRQYDYLEIQRSDPGEYKQRTSVGIYGLKEVFSLDTKKWSVSPLGTFPQIDFFFLRK